MWSFIFAVVDFQLVASHVRCSWEFFFVSRQVVFFFFWFVFRNNIVQHSTISSIPIKISSIIFWVLFLSVWSVSCPLFLTPPPPPKLPPEEGHRRKGPRHSSGGVGGKEETTADTSDYFFMGNLFTSTLSDLAVALPVNWAFSCVVITS